MRGLVLAVVVTASAALPALGSTVNLDTNATPTDPTTTGWQVVRYDDYTNPNNLPGVNSTYLGSVVNVTNLPGAWVTADTINGLAGSGHTAAWVSTAASYPGGDANGAEYLYSIGFTFDPNVTGPAKIQLDGYLSADNYVSAVALAYWDTTTNGVAYIPVTTIASDGTTGVGTAYEFTYAEHIYASTDNTIFQSPTNFVLLIDTVNSYVPTDRGTDPGPNGLIFAGQVSNGVGASPVPLPAAAWLGFSMLGGLGLVAKLRGRKYSAL